MKKLDTYINEKLVISKDIDNQYKYFPKTKEELKELIEKRIAEDGPECDLNDIDVSAITDMSELFNDMKNFNGDISQWDVSNVTDMHMMFNECISFNQDISEWDVRNVRDMSKMFCYCHDFNQDLSKWNVTNLKYAESMFMHCLKFDQDLNKWPLDSIISMKCMFLGCHSFHADKLESWNVVSANNLQGIFIHCKTTPSWYKE